MCMHGMIAEWPSQKTWNLQLHITHRKSLLQIIQKTWNCPTSGVSYQNLKLHICQFSWKTQEMTAPSALLLHCYTCYLCQYVDVYYIQHQPVLQVPAFKLTWIRAHFILNTIQSEKQNLASGFRFYITLVIILDGDTQINTRN